MTMTRISKSVLLAAALIGCLVPASRASDGVVKVAGDPYSPWTVGEAGAAAKGGIAVEIAQTLFKRLNLDSRVEIYPFKRGLERIRTGEEDVILMVSRSKEREEYMTFSSPIRQVTHGFYHAAGGSFDWGEWKDLTAYRIGNVSGYNLGEAWTKAVEEHGLDVEEVKGDVFNADKLLLGRIDAFIADREVMDRFIEENPKYQGKFEWHPKPVHVSVNNFGISHKSFLANRLQDIDGEIQAMKDDGSFQRIFCRYGKEFDARCTPK